MAKGRGGKRIGAFCFLGNVLGNGSARRQRESFPLSEVAHLGSTLNVPTGESILLVGFEEDSF